MSRRDGKAPAGPVSQLSLFGAPTVAPASPEPATPLDPDSAARAFAVDPRHNVVLEASAGTGKTSVLVARYVNLLKAGVDPANILAITFTRKAAAEMRERIIRELKLAADRSELDSARWLELRDRLGEIAISTIDAFCLSLLREFPLEADVDPAFDLADETEIPRLMATALDRTLRILVSLSASDDDVSLVLAQLGIARTREGLATLLDRRLVAWDALDRFLVRGPRGLTAASVCGGAASALQEMLQTVPGGLTAFLADGPSGHPRYGLFLREVQRLASLGDASDAAIRGVLERVSGHFLTTENRARKAGTAIPPYKPEHYPSKPAMKRHRDALFQIAPQIEQVMFAFNRDLNVVMARGVRRMFAIALEQYRRALEERSVLDFSDVLQRALQLLRQMDEFSQSRFRLESRYHHVLVDEFQDTSRAQWELVSLLVKAWGEGLGLATNPSIFIVGDRKQSIYRFRDAEVAVLHEAAEHIEGLRPGGRARRAISRSFRACPELLHFVNDVCTEISQPSQSAGEFTYDERDRFPVDVTGAHTDGGEPVLGVAVAETPDACAAAVADEIARLLREATVRDKSTGLTRPARAGDIGILFRSRTSHREFERELGGRGIPTYVYKGLGFFDADEIKDITALLRYLAEPTSNLRSSAFLRSRFIRISDRGLAALAPEIWSALLSDLPPPALATLEDEDRRVLEHVRPFVKEWLMQVDRAAPAELLERILSDTAYAFELGGARRRQAWENLKKMRGLVRRIQNRGYATLTRIADHLLALSAGDESNAVIEAIDAVNLMTVHAAKGLEFPIVFVVNLAKGASGPPRPVRIVVDGGPGSADEPSVSVGPFISETDEAERDRERHETRRLLYVALTRARDRLYLAATLKDGAFVPGRGSLAEVLPESLKAFFGLANQTFNEVETLGWSGVSGRDYIWRLCRPNPGIALAAVPGQPIDEPDAISQPDGDFSELTSDTTSVRLSTSEWIGDEMVEADRIGGARSGRLFGILLHRLFEAADHFQAQPDRSGVESLARRLLRADETVALENPETFAARAADAWLLARTRPDIVQVMSAQERWYEVPFSIAVSHGDATTVVRGTIDCVVRDPDGGLTVVEFKTGAPRDSHQRQLDLYVRAVRALDVQEREAASSESAHEGVRGLLVYL